MKITAGELYERQQHMFLRQRQASDAVDLAKNAERIMEEIKADARAQGLDPEAMLKEAHEAFLAKHKAKHGF